MNNNGMFYTNVDDYETKEDMMNDFIALRMYDMTKDKEIERLNNIINELEKYLWEERYNHQGEYVYTGKRKVEEVYTLILDKIKELKGDSSN